MNVDNKLREELWYAYGLFSMDLSGDKMAFTT
jgi:hypothetical protein